jgi:hypothetical protein
MPTATRIAAQTGITADGKSISRPEITTAKAALTISRTRNITSMNMERARAPSRVSLSAPTERPLLRTEAHSAPMSCTPAKKTVPSVTHRKAGPQPQITAIAGPTMGAAPATEVKWWPHSTYLLVGT